MSARMKAHWMNYDEQVLVTGTLDPAEALRFLESEAMKVAPGDGIEGDIVDKHLRALELKGIPERGSMVPQHSEAEHAWLWYAKDNGRVKAVNFQ